MDISTLLINLENLRKQLKEMHDSKLTRSGKKGASGQPINPKNHVEKLIRAYELRETDLAKTLFHRIYSVLANTTNGALPAGVFAGPLEHGWSLNTKKMVMESLIRVIEYPDVAEPVQEAADMVPNGTIGAFKQLLNKFKRAYDKAAKLQPHIIIPVGDAANPHEVDEQGQRTFRSLIEETDTHVHADIMPTPTATSVQLLEAQLTAQEKETAIYKELADRYWNTIMQLVNLSHST